MKKTLIIVAFVMTIVISTMAQTTSNLFIKGDMNIKYNTHETANANVANVRDVYKINLNVANSVQFHGTINDLPQIIGRFGTSVTQNRRLTFDIACDVINPKDPTQTRYVNHMYGGVPITSDGIYNYDQGTLMVENILDNNAPMGKFSGTTAGKPLDHTKSLLDSIRSSVGSSTPPPPVNINRNVNGKVVTMALTNYDIMEFRQHIIPGGPLSSYQPVTVVGTMLYENSKVCWFFNNMTLQYVENGKINIDRVSGSIRWDEDPDRKHNGLGKYEFDIRINEPVVNATEESLFSSTQPKEVDEASFFEVDNTLPGVTGTMKYKDRFVPGTTVTSYSDVSIDLTGNKITKQQLMAIGKIVIFSCIVPMNSD